MNILFLTPQLPYPPSQGTMLRNYHLIEGLAPRHRVSLLSFLEPGQPTNPAGMGPLADLCDLIETVSMPGRSLLQRLAGLASSRQPDMALRLQSQAFAKTLAGLLGRTRFDVVQIEGIEMAPYMDLLAALPAEKRPLIVFDEHNAEYVLQQRAYQTDLRVPRRWHAAAYSYIQWRRLRRYEARMVRLADRVVAVSDRDRLALETLAPGAQVSVVPNCIDTASYAQDEDVSDAEVQSFTVLFTGKMDFRPNIDAALWFGREIWPQIRERRSGATWGIVGKAPHPRLDALLSDPTITIVGQVPDIRPYFHAAEVYVIPLRMGGGTRFKLLEAFAAGAPVVSTRIGAEGVPVKPGAELLLADDPAQFAAAVVRLLDDKELRSQMHRAGMELVQRSFDWRSVVPALEAIYDS